MNFYGLLSNLVLLIHFAFVAFILGGLVVIWIGYFCGLSFVRNRGFRLAHLGAMAIVLLETVLGIICPLTTWEDQLRRRAGQEQGYRGSFIQYWVGRILFYDLADSVFTFAYVAVFTLIVLTFWLAPPRQRQ